MRFILCTFFIFLLSGCQTFIAYQVTKPVQEISFDGPDNQMLSDAYKGFPTKICKTKQHCLTFRTFSNNDLKKYFGKGQEFRLYFELNSKDVIETFNTTLTSINGTKKVHDSVIVLFPGHGVNSMIYSIQARWLSHFTGKDVIVMPASNQYQEFKFGLNSLDVLIHYLSNSQYKQIDILSYSMGSIAAIQLAENISNINQQIMIAPMVNFDSALMSVAKSYQPTLSLFVRDDDFKNAAENVISDSGIDKSQLDLNALLTNKKPAYRTRTILYVSNGDTVSPAYYWQALQNESVSVVHYSNLNHVRMVSLINQAMRNEVLHRLM